MNYVLRITFALCLITQSAAQCLQLAECTCQEPTKIICKLANLTVVPNINNNVVVSDVSVVWLDLSDNNITRLNRESFVWSKMNLRHLNLQDNNIDTIETGAFDPLSNLIYLNLATNNIGNFPAEILKTQSHLLVLMLSRNENLQLSPSGYNLPALTKLNLRHCKLKNISISFFQNMRNISQLNIAHNLLSHLDEELFASLPYLQYLSLSSNRLTSLGSVMRVPSSVEVELWGNPWRCDCKLATDFHVYSLTRDVNPLLCGISMEETFNINASSYLSLCGDRHSSSPAVHSRVEDGDSMVLWSVVVFAGVVVCVALVVVNPVRLYIGNGLTKVVHFFRDLECVNSEDDDEGLMLTDPHTTEMSVL